MRTKRILPLLAAALLLVLAGCASSGGKLAGSWIMLDENGQPTRNTKILSEDRFAFGVQADPTHIWAGGGTWKLEDGNYFETVEYHSAPALVGKTIRFDCKLIDNLWYHEGSLRAGGENFHIVEVWRRIDSKPDKKD